METTLGNNRAHGTVNAANKTLTGTRRVRRTAIWMTLTLSAVTMFAPPAGAQGLLLDTFNTAGVAARPSGPPSVTYFGTFNKKANIGQVATYHWNNGRGAGP